MLFDRAKLILLLIESGVIMKKYSVLGDSVSTFEGYQPSNYSVFYDKETCIKNEMKSVNDTWWYIVGEKLGASLCVNDSYSGSRVSGTSFPAASCDERLRRLRTADEIPDIILVYIGFNDFGYGVEIESKIGNQTAHDEKMFFAYAYEYMLNRLKELYPNTRIICGTLVRTRVRTDPYWLMPSELCGINFRYYNNAIRSICRKCGVVLADLALLDTEYETLDGSHPTAKGHREFADMWIKCLV